MGRNISSAKELYPYFLSSTGVTTDTRSIRQGNIFFALKGGNFNGNKFALQALNDGCAYAVTDEAVGEDERIFQVHNVLEALQQLARFHRDQLSVKVLGLTGSNGKTTTKELLHQVLSKKFKTLATEGNLNNHIGVPLTLLKLNESHEIAVIEMGANHRGEIALLSELANPEMGVITNIGKAHLEGFGGEEGVKLGKGELFDFLRKKNGEVFVHSDSEVLMEMSEGLKRTTYGSANGEVTGEVTAHSPFLEISWSWNKSKFGVSTQLTGPYNLPNILCAITVGLHQGIEPQLINQAISDYCPSNKRSQVAKKGAMTLILDSYNANPDSMAAAILNLAELPGSHKAVFLGDMKELGESTLPEHEKIIELLKAHGISEGALVGPVFNSCKSAIPTFPDVAACIEQLDSSAFSDALVLIKGSRGIQMEKVADALMEQHQEPT